MHVKFTKLLKQANCFHYLAIIFSSLNHFVQFQNQESLIRFVENNTIYTVRIWISPVLISLK